MNSKENIKEAVLTAIRSNDMFSFDDMMQSMELSFVELSAIIGLLLKEKKVSLCINHAFIFEKGTYKSRQEEIVESKVMMDSMKLFNTLLAVSHFLSNVHACILNFLVGKYRRGELSE